MKSRRISNAVTPFLPRIRPAALTRSAGLLLIAFIMQRNTLPFITFLLALGLPAAAPAQQVAPAAPAPASDRRPPAIPVTSAADETVMLSPFTVSTGTDRGYQALNTLSGTRLNSKLEDLGASITVVTKQQMEDLAILDLNDVFLYEASTEGTGNYTQFTPNRNGGMIDGTANDPARANRIRGVGSPISGSGVNIAVGNFS